eukprot:TRINITY_DN104572_c0_g1_i1.p1 TRINITY_DN104572_c0_g1~~TRINITY_DN104572_c0_g1_i1.p1  ORF type:complete len:190 (-),score=26.46 TRINITY_DN104572_c0_g1_i1:413-907(-)
MEQKLCVPIRDMNTVSSACRKKSRARSRGRSNRKQSVDRLQEIISQGRLNQEDAKADAQVHRPKLKERLRKHSMCNRFFDVMEELLSGHGQEKTRDILRASLRKSRARSLRMRSDVHAILAGNMEINVATNKKGCNHDAAQPHAWQPCVFKSSKGSVSQTKISL